MRCSKGTYVRALARDLGRALGVGAHVTALRRTRSGPFSLAEARPLDEVLAALAEPGADAAPALPLVEPADALRHLERRVVTEGVARDVAPRASRIALEAGEDGARSPTVPASTGRGSWSPCARAPAGPHAGAPSCFPIALTR